ncbi:MAG: MarR family transcriptional regulator [Mycobacterium sp.]
MTDLAVLQGVRLKGRVSRADLAATLAADPSDTVDDLTRSGLLLDGPTLRLSPEGRARLDELLVAERAHVDHAAMSAAYNDFRAVNTELKELLTDWQVRDGQPNTHDDSYYDAAVLARLDVVHQRVTPIVAAAAAQLPRLGRYSTKLQTALDKVHAGETVWLSRPLIDSYHTVWFELHEELILAAGSTRENDDA